MIKDFHFCASTEPKHSLQEKTTTIQLIKLDSSKHLRATPFPLADANGNCVTYLDDAGNVQAHYTYDAFGNTVSQTGDMADDFRFRFSSKYLDDETGLYYYGYRWYSPAFGRWMNWDPLKEEGGFNLYSFVANEPVSYWDFLGLEEGKKKEYCCDGAEIDELARKMANEAMVKTLETRVEKPDMVKNDKGDWVAADSMITFHVEFSGRICCSKDGGVSDTGLHQGSIVWQDDGWKSVSDISSAPKCKGDSKEVAIYHSHPDAAMFSPADKLNQCIYLRNTKGYICYRYKDGQTCYWSPSANGGEGEWKCMQ